MSPQASLPTEIPALPKQICDAIDLRYEESRAEHYGIALETFQQYVVFVVMRYGADFDEADKLALIRSLHIEELVLARACSAGNEAAWNDFITRFRGELYLVASRISKDDMTGRELADGLHAELYGLPNQDGRRVSKLDYYMGRGSLGGWLRTVLAQRHVDRCRSHAKNVSLDEQLESGVSFAATEETDAALPDERVGEVVAQTLTELNGEERFLLAAYYLDRQTLAAIGLQLRMHESTVSRKIEKLTATVRKRIRTRLLSSGMNARRCEEILEDMDVRDLNIDVAANLRQEKKIETF